MKSDSLIVSETFYSIQGEGVHSGVPAVFLRLAGCNLLCESKDWRCDTIEVWRKGKNTYFENVLKKEYIKKLRDVNTHLVITGGEPLLHQSSIVSFLEWFSRKYGFKPIVEIETNGTIEPIMRMKTLVNFWNVSFKLSNSGESFAQRVNEVALRMFNTMHNATFKIVISKKEDVLEMIEDFSDLVDMGKVILMPAGETRDKLDAIRPMLVDICKEFGFRYCDRLHIIIWNQKTGV